MFFVIVFGLPVIHGLWWAYIHRRLGDFRRAGRWRAVLGVMAGGLLALFAYQIGSRWWDRTVRVPAALLALTYVWFLVIMPVSAVLASPFAGWEAMRGRWRRAETGARRRDPCGPARPSPDPSLRGRGVAVAWSSGRASRESRESPESLDLSESPELPDSTDGLVSRRRVLTAIAGLAPPVAAAAGTVRAIAAMGDFRVRRFEVALPALPPPLEGMTIVNVSDVHVGAFTNGATLRRVADAANGLRADLIVLTGDLIDHSLADLPAGVEMVRRLDAPGGVWMCEGNHDLFESRSEFERRVRAAGVPLLLNEAATVRVRGEEFQLLGLRWGAVEAAGGSTPSRRGAGVESNVEAVAARRDAGAFAILLAHHPHAFDAAAEAGVPLTLSGHTHGGQLMLTESIGAGPLLFRYWSGLYRRGGSALVVSNGVGNWFPLRLNAPAELVHVTLRRG